MNIFPDHGEETYKGSGRLLDRKAVITGGDSGIGRAVAIAFAREGADVLLSYLSEHEDAEDTRRQVDLAGRKAVLVPGDIQRASHCRDAHAAGRLHHQYGFNQFGQPQPDLARLRDKGAIHNFTAGLAQLLAPKDIRANTVAPGPICTPLIPAGRVGHDLFDAR